MEVHSSPEARRALRWKVTDSLRVLPRLASTPENVGLAVYVVPQQEMTDEEAIGREVRLPLRDGGYAIHVITRVVRDNGVQVLFFRNLFDYELRLEDIVTT